MFCCEFCEVFKDNLFVENLQATASAPCIPCAHANLDHQRLYNKLLDDHFHPELESETWLTKF